MCVAECENCGMNEKEISYQIHITATPNPKSNFECHHDLNFFGYLNDIKVVNVLNKHKDGRYTGDTFTSVNVKDSPIYNMAKLVEKLQDNNFTILRTKIETVPWNPEIPKYFNVYYEKHWSIAPIVSVDTCEKLGISVSKNIRNDRTFITYRHNFGWDTPIIVDEYYKKFEKKADLIKNSVYQKYNVFFDKDITEVCIHDSNRNRDKEHFGFRVKEHFGI